MDANQKGTGDVKRFVKHWFAWIRESDEGSGTISGVALIAVAAIMLSAIASAGNLLLCLHRAQNAADLASVAAPTRYMEALPTPVTWRNVPFPVIMRRSDPAR